MMVDAGRVRPCGVVRNTLQPRCPDGVQVPCRGAPQCVHPSAPGSSSSRHCRQGATALLTRGKSGLAVSVFIVASSGGDRPLGCDIDPMHYMSSVGVRSLEAAAAAAADREHLSNWVLAPLWCLGLSAASLLSSPSQLDGGLLQNTA
jgi:hypothetical protein